MFENIWNWLENTMESFKTFIINHSLNPLLWLGLFGAGLLIFALTYNALNKHK